MLAGPSGTGRPSPSRHARFPFVILILLLACAPRAHAVVPPPGGGPLPAEVRRAIEDGRTRPAAVTSAGPGLEQAAGTTGRWNVPVLLVAFPDRPPTYPAANFTPLLFDTTGAFASGSMAKYYDEVSGGLLQVRGRVFGWKTLPDTVNFYANDSYGLARLAFPQNDAGLLYATLAAFDDSVDFSQYDRNGDGYVDCVLLVHSDMGAEGAASDRRRFWSITSTVSNAWGQAAPYVTKDPRPGHPGQFMKVDQFSVLPEMSAVEFRAFTEIGVYCHEFGHDLGWPDLYDASSLGGGTNLGPGNWCLMATGAFGGDSRTPSRPTHPCGWAKYDAGWIGLENLVDDGDHRFGPVASEKTAYRLWYQGEASDEWFLLENRQRTGFDSGLPGHGLLVYRIQSDVIATKRILNTVNSGQIPGLRVEEADGHYDMMSTINRGDARDPFPGTTGNDEFADATIPSTLTYAGRPLNTSLQAIREIGTDVRAYVQLLPTGWSAPIDIGTLTGGGLTGNGATNMVADPSGDLWLATVDDGTGQSEIVLRRKRFGIDWGAPIPLTNEPGVSNSPAMAIDRNGRKAIAWWDTRDGNSEIYYAWAPAGGAFGPARRVTNNTSFSQLPVVTWTLDGRIAIAWTDGRDGGSSIYERTFFPDQEASRPDVRVSFPDGFQVVANSGAPTITSVGNRLVILFQERLSGVDEIKGCVDSLSAFTQPRLFSETDGFTSNQPTLCADTDTSAWFFWRDNLPSHSEIRMGRWSARAGWSLAFESPYASAQPLDGPRAFTDSAHDVHLLFRRSGNGQTELVETVWHRGNGVWDAGPSLLTAFRDEQLVGTAFAADAVGRTHAVWLGVSSLVRRLREMVRAAPALAPVGVPAADSPIVPHVTASPNPARGRLSLSIDQPLPQGARASLVNVAGREVASIPLARGSVSWDGTDLKGDRVAPGVLFVRVLARDGRTLARGRIVWLP